MNFTNLIVTDHCVIFTLLYVKMKTKSVIVAQISFCKYIPDINLLTKKVCSLFFFPRAMIRNNI